MSEERIIYRTQHLRGTKEEWNAHINNSENEPIYGDIVVPLAGEFAIEIDESDSKLHRLKIGDGYTPYNDLPYMSVDNFVLPTRIKLTLKNKWTEKYQDDDVQSAVLYYYQNITTEQYGQVQDECIDNDSIKMLTSNSRVDLYNTDVAQLINFKENNLVFQAENDPVNGMIKVICLENKPSDTIDLWCTITELIDLQPNNIIYGNIVGVPASGGSSSEGGVTSYDKLSEKPILVGRKHIDNGEVFNTSDAKDYPPKDGGKINNTAMGEYTASFGHGSRSGIKGYKITEITISDGAKTAEITVTGVIDTWKTGERVYIDCDIHSMGIYKIDAINNNEGNSYITISHPEGENIDSRLKKSAEDTDGMENWIWNPSYPDDGEDASVVIRSNTAFSSGDNTYVVGHGAAGFGRNNKVYGDYGFTAGKDNTVNYAGTAFGQSNKATGESASVFGYSNEASGSYSEAHGHNSKATATSSFAFGEGVQSTVDGQTVVGKYNDENETGLFVVGNGDSDSKSTEFVTDTLSTEEFLTINKHSNIIKDTLHISPLFSDGEVEAFYPYKIENTDIYAYINDGSSEANEDLIMHVGTVDYSTGVIQLKTPNSNWPYAKISYQYIMGPSNAFRVLHDGTAELQKQGETDNSVVIRLELNKRVTQITNEINNTINPQIADINSDIADINSDIADINSDIADINSDIADINSDIESINTTMPIVSEAEPELLSNGQVWLQPAVMADYPVYVGQMETTLNSYTWVWYIEVRNSGRVDLKGTLKASITRTADGWTTSGGGAYAEMPGCTFPTVNEVQLPGDIITINSGFIVTDGIGNCWYWTEKVSSTGVDRGYIGRFTKNSVTGRPSLDIAGQLSPDQLTEFLSKL